MHTQPISPLMMQFLTWVAAGPRSYGDTMEAWRTTCPRMTVWEDAVSEGLVRLEANGAKNDCRVSLTARGRTILAAEAGTFGAEPSPAHAERKGSRPG
jgi:hypothetical protein